MDNKKDGETACGKAKDGAAVEREKEEEDLDALQKNGGRLHPNLRRQCLLEVGIVVDESMRRSEEIRLVVSVGLSIRGGLGAARSYF